MRFRSLHTPTFSVYGGYSCSILKKIVARMLTTGFTATDTKLSAIPPPLPKSSPYTATAVTTVLPYQVGLSAIVPPACGHIPDRITVAPASRIASHSLPTGLLHPSNIVPEERSSDPGATAETSRLEMLNDVQ